MSSFDKCVCSCRPGPNDPNRMIVVISGVRVAFRQQCGKLYTIQGTEHILLERYQSTSRGNGSFNTEIT